MTIEELNKRINYLKKERDLLEKRYNYYANLGVSLSNYSALRKGATPTTTSYSYYWERSAGASSTYVFCSVDSYGNAVYNDANITNGVVVGFSLSLTHNA